MTGHMYCVCFGHAYVLFFCLDFVGPVFTKVVFECGDWIL